MRKYKSTLKKALFTAIIAIVAGIGNKAFAQEYTGFFKTPYSSSNEIANAVEAGNLALVDGVDTLVYINHLFANYNSQISYLGCTDLNGNTYSLGGPFTNIKEAKRSYIDVLRNYSADKPATWTYGEVKISRRSVSTGKITQSLLRGPGVGETANYLDLRLLPGIVIPEGKSKEIPGGSNGCGNAIAINNSDNQETPQNNQNVAKGKVDTVYKTTLFVNRTVVQNQVVQQPSSNMFANYSGSQNTGFGGTVTYAQQPSTATAYDNGNNYSQTHDNGNTYVTNNVHDNGNTTTPTPVIMKQNNGPIVAAMVMNGLLTAYAIWSQGRWQQYQPNQYYSLNNTYANYQNWNGGMPSFQPQPIQGFATQGNTGFPIQGNTGFATFSNPIQGYSSGGTFGNPIQGYGNGGFGQGVQGFATFQ